MSSHLTTIHQDAYVPCTFQEPDWEQVESVVSRVNYLKVQHHANHLTKLILTRISYLAGAVHILYNPARGSCA
jgi:hypothetical protein